MDLKSHFGFSDKPTYNNAVEVAYDAAQRFADEQFDELRIVYTLFKSALAQMPTAEVILPLEAPKEEASKAGEAQVKANTQYLFMPEAEEIKSLPIWHLVIWKLLFMPHSYNPQPVSSVPV